MPAAKHIILLVDDEPSILETMAELLDWEGYQVVTATNGQLALEVLEKTSPALVLMDFMMPVLDGVQTLKRIRADERWSRLPVLMMSAAATPPSEGRSLWTAFLHKPMELNVLLTLIREQIGRGRAS